jgi:hypothetical protein
MLGFDEGCAGEGDHREVVARVVTSEAGGDHRQMGLEVRPTMRVDVGERRKVVAGPRNQKVDAVYILRLDNPAKNKEYNATYILAGLSFRLTLSSPYVSPLSRSFATSSMIPACSQPHMHPSRAFPSRREESMKLVPAKWT